VPQPLISHTTHTPNTANDDDDNDDDAYPPKESKKNAAHRFDIDGATYLQSVLSIAACGNGYIETRTPGHHPIEALRRVLSDLRNHLSLVGFSDRTVAAGVPPAEEGGAVGVGEGAVLDELWRFRNGVREAALKAVRDGGRAEKGRDGQLAEEILGICDAVRDGGLPGIGVEMSDGSDTKWKYCLPRQQGGGRSRTASIVDTKCGATVVDDDDGVLVNMFTIGQYSGLFSRYDTGGIPTHNSDGTEVSKRLRKKLMKKKSKKENK